MEILTIVIIDSGILRMELIQLDFGILANKLGVMCGGEEEEILEELERMEERDFDVLKRQEEGNKSGFL